MSPDLAARQILVAAYLYYVMDSRRPSMDDATYDRLSRFVARNWDDLHPDRKWACKSAEETRSSGCHFRFSMQCVSAALNKGGYGGFLSDRMPSDDDWRITTKGRRFVTCSYQGWPSA